MCYPHHPRPTTQYTPLFTEWGHIQVKFMYGPLYEPVMLTCVKLDIHRVAMECIRSAKDTASISCKHSKNHSSLTTSAKKLCTILWRVYFAIYCILPIWPSGSWYIFGKFTCYTRSNRLNIIYAMMHYILFRTVTKVITNTITQALAEEATEVEGILSWNEVIFCCINWYPMKSLKFKRGHSFYVWSYGDTILDKKMTFCFLGPVYRMKIGLIKIAKVEIFL